MATVDRNIRRNTDLTTLMVHQSEHFNPINGRDINAGAVQLGAFGIPQDIVINLNGKYDLTPRWIRAASPSQYEENVALSTIFKKYKMHDISDSCPERLMNYRAIHVLVIGNFDDETPTIAQQQALKMFVQEVVKSVPTVREVLFHSDVSNTSCPGIFFRPDRSELQRIFEHARTPTERVLYEPIPNIVPILTLVDNTMPDVNLSWNDVQSQAHVDVAYYNIYRIDVTSHGVLTKIGTSTTLAFVDTAITDGFTYTYYVTTVLNNGQESGLSNAVTTTVVSIAPLQYLYVNVSDSSGQAIAVVDVSAPTAPVYLGVALVPVVSPITLGPQQAIMDNTYMYIVYQRALRIFDWRSNPLTLTQIGAYTDVTKDLRSHLIRLSDTRILATSSDNTIGLLSFDITDKTNPTLLTICNTVGNFDNDNPGSGCIDVNGVWWGSTHNSSTGQNGLKSVPVGTEPLGATTFRVSDFLFSKNPNVMIGTYLYHAYDSAHTVVIYDVSSGAPVLITAVTLSPADASITYMGLRGTQLFLALNEFTGRTSVQIWDVSIPTAPTLIVVVPAVTGLETALNTQILVNGNYLYTASRVTGVNFVHLVVHDISVIATPQLVANIDIPTGTNPNNALFVTGYPNELQKEGRNLDITA